MVTAEDRLFKIVSGGCEFAGGETDETWDYYLEEIAIDPTVIAQDDGALNELNRLLSNGLVDTTKDMMFAKNDDGTPGVRLSALEVASRTGRYDFIPGLLVPTCSDHSPPFLLAVEQMLTAHSLEHKEVVKVFLEHETPRPRLTHAAVAYAFCCSAAAGFSQIVYLCLYKWRSSLTGLSINSKAILSLHAKKNKARIPLPKDDSSLLTAEDEAQAELRTVIEHALSLASRGGYVVVCAEILRAWSLSRSEMMRVLRRAFDDDNETFVLQLINFNPYLRREIEKPQFCQSQREAALVRRLHHRVHNTY